MINSPWETNLIMNMNANVYIPSTPYVSGDEDNNGMQKINIQEEMSHEGL